MIPKEKELKLIKLYMYICDVYESSLKFYFRRLSNNNHFGIKLPAVASRRKGTVPFPEMLILSTADENDSTVFKRECVGNLNNREIYADKIYSDIPFYKETKESKKLELFTSVKAIKGESPEITKREKAARDLFSTALSKVRQPIESLLVE
ncbi:transposase [Bacteroides caecimuris]|uniref:transposase n=1 Tax=Bacteroides caecimuris TaxID=1796613 RepID=UPI0020CCDCD6|nr:transposase [Bacteroides caecimuris]